MKQKLGSPGGRTMLGALAQQQQEAFAHAVALQAARDAVVETATVVTEKERLFRQSQRGPGTIDAWNAYQLALAEMFVAVAALLALQAREEGADE